MAIQELYRIYKTYNPPDFVKTAAYDEETATVFLDIVNKTLPCDSKGATWLSAARFYDGYENYKPSDRYRIEARLHKVASHFGIVKDIERLKKAVDENKRENIPDSRYGLIIGDKKYFPIRNAREVKAASDWLITNRKHLKWSYRHPFACKVVKYAQEYNVKVPGTLNKMAGYGICSKQDIIGILQQRNFILSNFNRNTKEAKNLLTKISGIVESQKAPIKRDVLLKVAEFVDTLDRQYNLVNDKYTFPEDILFGISPEDLKRIKRAMVYNRHTGNYYNKDDLALIPIRSLYPLGDDIIKEVECGKFVNINKLASVIEKLPKYKAELFEKIAADNNVLPIACGKIEL